MLEVLRDFVQKAKRAEFSYMITGSFAMSAYGEIRFTRDIDIVVELEPRNIERFFEIFAEDYYVSKNAVSRAVENGSMFNLIHLQKAVKIDCIILKDDEFEKLKFERRRETHIGECKFWTITKEDLIISKLNWAKNSLSEMQIKDIANLSANDYEVEYVKNWIECLKLENVWREVSKWKTQHLK